MHASRADRRAASAAALLASSSPSAANPSAWRSQTSTACLESLAVRRDQIIRRQQAQPYRRRLRPSAFPCRKASIRFGSGQLSHSASVIGSLSFPADSTKERAADAHLAARRGAPLPAVSSNSVPSCPLRKWAAAGSRTAARWSGAVNWITGPVKDSVRTAPSRLSETRQSRTVRSLDPVACGRTEGGTMADGRPRDGFR